MARRIFGRERLRPVRWSSFRVSFRNSWLWLHQQDGLHAHPQDIVLRVGQVFEEFDDGQDEVRAAVPAEHIVQDRSILLENLPADGLGIVHEHDKRGIVRIGLQFGCQGENTFILLVVHADDHVDAVVIPQDLTGTVRRFRPDKPGRIAQVQVDVFPGDGGLDLAVFVQDESIVVAADHQDLADSEMQQGFVHDLVHGRKGISGLHDGGIPPRLRLPPRRRSGIPGLRRRRDSGG